jgi:hypothetical protein
MKFLSDARTILAFGITVAAVLGITLLAGITIYKDYSKAQSVLNSVLPLFGTWVGTVLAFYFSRENFEAASTSTERLVDKLSPEEKLRSTLVTNVMIKNIFSISDLDTKVEVIFKQLTTKRYLPVMKISGGLEALLYREGLMVYLYDIPDADRSNKTIGDLLKEKPDLKQTPAFVREGGTLAEAKEALEKIDNCKVVLVTKNGAPGEKVVGLLTTTDISKYSIA